MSEQPAGRGDQQFQSLTLIEAFIPIASLIVLVGLAYSLFGDRGMTGPSQVALVVAAMIAVVIGWRRGHTLDSMREAAIASVASGMSAVFILFAVGALIGTWALSGTMLAMVHYGMQILSPNFFYLSAGGICALVAAGIGTSWTTIGTIGIGLMGVSEHMGLDPAITAGAVISGAYFGDATSPISSAPTLAAAAGGAPLYDTVKATAPVTLAALFIALGVFWWIGGRGELGAGGNVIPITSYFTISPVLLLPLVIVGVLAVIKMPPFSALFIGAIAGGVLALFVAPERVIRFADPEGDLPSWLALLKGVWLALASGYTSTSGDPALDRLASRGGMESMLDTIWLILVALAFGGVIEKVGVLERLITPIVAAAKSVGTLVTALVAAVIGTNVATADQYLSIVLPARMFKSAFMARGLSPVVLSRTVGTCGTPTSALIPWNSCGAYVAQTLGVATFSYFPYAVFNLACPLLIIGLAYSGIRILSTELSGPEPVHQEDAHVK